MSKEILDILRQADKNGSFPYGFNIEEETVLNLHYCDIDEIPEWIAELPNLERLQLDKNYIEHVPAFIEDMRARGCEVLI